MVIWYGDEVLEHARQAVAQGLVAATELVRTEAISLILDTPKSGRIYRRRSVTHRASAPGEPPASDTGFNVNSITTDYDFGSLSGTVTARSQYAPYLEYGTRNMEPRPFMRPALMNKKDEIERIIASSIAVSFRS